MPLAFDSRRLDRITVITCTGRIVEDESGPLQRHLDEMFRFGPDLLLHLGSVEFIDSCGLGLLARYLARSRHAGGTVKLCAVPSRLGDVLRITKLSGIFDVHPSEADAIAAFYRSGPVSATRIGFDTDVLCVDSSADVVTYVAELLRQAGYAVTTAGNLPDALILLKIKRPKGVVLGATLRAARGTRTADTFNTLVEAMPAVVLPLDFAQQEAGAAADWLLSQVRAIVGPGSGAVPTV